MRILLLIIYLFVIPAFAADVYRSVDENGNVIYTDKPTPDAEKIRIDEIQTIEPPDTPEFTYTPPTPRDKPGQYKTVEITSPTDGSAIRSDDGNISISAAVNPGLSSDHNLILYLDGKEVSSGGPQFNLSNVDRGSHSASVAIIDRNGSEIMRSSPVSFTLQRESVLEPSAEGRQMPTAKEAAKEGRGFSPQQLPPANQNPALPHPPPPPAP